MPSTPGSAAGTAAPDAGFAAKVAAAWGQGPPDPAYSFYLFPPLRRYFHRRLSGRSGEAPRDWYEAWAIQTYLAGIIPVQECLSIGCGYGEIERILARHHVFLHCTGLDLSLQAIEAAAARAREEGFHHIDYRIADLNTIELEPEKYDLVWSIGTLHHITSLERLLGQIKRALRPGGYLIANEYVGPNLMQLPARQLELINSVIHLIPLRLRSRSERTVLPPSLRYSPLQARVVRLWRSLRGDAMRYRPEWSFAKKAGFAIYLLARWTARPWARAGSPRFEYGKLYDNDPQYARHVDPSEGVRASEIVPLIRATFDEVDVRYYHGSILQHALDGRFFEAFDPERAEDCQVLDLLIQIEETMIRLGEVGSDNASIVARKR